MKKQDIICRDLSRKIVDGEFTPTEALPSLRALSATYQTSVNSVRQAIDILQADGLITKHQGKGIFVNTSEEMVKNVMIISRLEGDLFSDFTREFTRIFSSHREFFLQQEELPVDKESALLLEKKIKNLISKRLLDAVFFAGNDLGQTDFLLKKYNDKLKLYCFWLNEKKITSECPCIISDWYTGANMGVEHLNNAGCRKLLIITHRIDIYSEDNVHNDFLKGCRDKAKELGIPLIELHKQVDAPDYVETIREIFMDNHDLDGVFSLGDYMLIPLYQLMPELGRKIGDDIAILGYYNTPWCGLLTPKLSSIDIKVKDIVDTACGMYFKDIEALSKNIEPEIIIRKSSCLNKKIV